MTSSSPQLQAIAESVQKMYRSPPPPTAPRPLASRRGQPISYAVLPMKTSTLESQKKNQGISEQTQDEKLMKQPWVLQKSGAGTRPKTSGRKPAIDTDSGNYKETTLHVSQAKPTDVSHGAQKSDNTYDSEQELHVSLAKAIHGKVYNDLKKELDSLRGSFQKEIATLKTELSHVIASVESLTLKCNLPQDEVKHKPNSIAVSTGGYVTCSREPGAEAAIQSMHSVDSKKNLQELRNLNTTEVS